MDCYHDGGLPGDTARLPRMFGHNERMALLPDHLDAGDIALKRLNPRYVDEMVAAVVSSFPELHQWMTWAEQVPTRDEVAEFARAAQSLFDANVAWAFAMSELTTGEIVGSCDVRLVRDTSWAEIGYWVRSDRTGRGYASAAARALTDAALRYLDVDRVTIRMDQGNIASASVPPKIGYRLLGEEARKIETPGHTGRGFVWTCDREA
jgi:ribosomal-protein-serine acetyltransferase